MQAPRLNVPKGAPATRVALARAIETEYDDLEDSPGRKSIGFVCSGQAFCPFPSTKPLIPPELAGIIGQGDPDYQLDVPLQLVTKDRGHEQVIDLVGKQKRFVFNVADRPVRLTVDQGSRLFRMLEPAELPATVNDLRASKNQLVVVASGSAALVDASRDLLRGLQWHRANLVDEAAYLASPAPDVDILILGWPQSEDLHPELPPGITGSEKKFVLDGESLSEKPDVLFMVKKTDKDDRVVAYFLPGSVAAAQDTARRIPHYGRYSYLLFRDGQNRIKATWEPENSTLQVIFNKDERQ